MSDHSFVFLFEGLERHLCGYCKNEKGNISHGMWAKYLTVEDYQNLIDRGWRRSGNYCYKPLMNEICCPMYTIKCDALNFQLSKSQKKVIKKFNKYLKDGVLEKTSQNFTETSDNISDFIYREAPKQMTDANISQTESSGSSDDIKVVESQKSIFENKEKSENLKVIKNGVGADPNKPPCKKAKIIRMERKKEKLLKRGMSLEKICCKNEQKNLEDFLSETPLDGKHKFKLELVHTASPDWEKVKKIEFNLYKKYQMIVHNDPPEKCKMEGFLRFLVNSPLQHVKFSRDSDLGFGSFHQLYWLDDKLIAVGVVDILPKCVSAVYFFYDPDYRDLTLGTYGSLREVEFVRFLHQKNSSIENYYMGFYIHSCPKMRYKGKLTPSFLLCPETYHWVSIEKCQLKIEVSKYSKLVEDENEIDENSCSENDLNEMKILVNRKLMLYLHFKRQYGEQEVFRTFSKLVGRKCTKSLIFVGDH